MASYDCLIVAKALERYPVRGAAPPSFPGRGAAPTRRVGYEGEVQTVIEIREVLPGDALALAALESAAPESNPLAVRLEPRVGYLEIVGRYPGVRGYVAHAGVRGQVVGMLFASVAPTQLNGAVVPGVYLFSLRVRPTVRRRGVASALVTRAWERARAEAGVEVAWAGVAQGNTASLRTFARAEFTSPGHVAVRIVPPLTSLSSLRGALAGCAFARPGLAVRPAALADLPALADALNGAHAGHNFWRPTSPERLARELTAAGHTLQDTLVVLSAGGALCAAGAVFDVRRVARLRFLGHRRLPEAINRVLRPITDRAPLRPLVLRHRLLPPLAAGAARALVLAVQRRYGPRLTPLVVPLDRRDPAWPTLPGPSILVGRVHVMVRSAAQVELHRPLHVG